MRKIYLARDKNSKVYGFPRKPRLNKGKGQWMPRNPFDTCWYHPIQLKHFGINVREFAITHEKPIMIKAAWWEEVE